MYLLIKPCVLYVYFLEMFYLIDNIILVLLSPAPGYNCPAQSVKPEGRPRREEDAGHAEGLGPGIVRGSLN